MAVKIKDEDAAGKVLHQFTLDNLDETLTVREVIRARVYQEVNDYNQAPERTYPSLIEISPRERQINGERPESKQVDWEAVFAKAIEAFESNGFFIVIGDQQVERLDQEYTISVDTEVSFVKLVPLVGG